MSVDAIGAQNAQERRINPIGSAIAGGVGLGAVAATVGYVAGNKRPDLEKVFTQEPDSFKSEAVKGKDAEAAKKLQDAVTEYKNAGDNEAKKWLSAQHEVGDAIVNTSVDNKADLDKAITEAQAKLDTKKVKIGEKEYTRSELKQAFKEAKAAVNIAADDKAKADAKQQLETARKNLNTFSAEAKDEIKGLNNAKKALRTAQNEAFKKAAEVADSEAMKKVTAANNARSAYANAKSTKLSEILGRDEIKQAFEKIKEGIPKKGGLKWAGIAGGIAAAVGLIAGYVMGKGGDNA